MKTTCLLAMLGLLTLAFPIATAAPPAGSTCVSGYNPNALSNVCTAPGQPTTVPTGSVSTSNQPVCIIGDVCHDVPVPSYDPRGGSTDVPTEIVYVEVLGHGVQV